MINIKRVRSKSIKKFLIPFILVSLITFFSVLTYYIFNNKNTIEHYNSGGQKNTSLTTIIQKQNWADGNSKSFKKILVNDSVSGSFVAKENNLGIIAIPFNTYGKASSDNVIFRLREKGKSNWLFQSNVSANQFQDNVPFPFGFPIIKDSKNVEYYFEIKSQKGDSSNAISISKDNYYIVKYKFSKSEILQSKTELITFPINKIIIQSSLLTIIDIISSLLFSLVIFVFLFFLYAVIKFLKIEQRIGKFIAFLNLRGFVKYIIDQKTLKKIGNFIHQNQLFILIILLLVTLLTRFAITYSDKRNILIPPDAIIMQPWIGGDFQVGVMKVLGLMIQGKNYDYGSYGSAFTLLTAPFVYLLDYFKSCTILDVNSCSIILYHCLLVLVIGGYILYITMLSPKNKESLSILLLIFIIFILGIIAALGLERGNIDIILSVIFGFLMLLVLLRPSKKKQKIFNIVQAIIIGFICALFINSKFFLLPIGLVAIYGSRKLILSLISFISIFCLFGYLPSIIYHTQSNPFSSVENAILWGSTHAMFTQEWALKFNVSFNAVASLATNCVEKQTCKGQPDVSIIAAISGLLFIFVFIFPFISAGPIKNYLKGTRKQINLGYILKRNYRLIIELYQTAGSVLVWLYKQRLNKYFIILLFILGVAAMNLLPEFSFTYRLWYSLPLLLLLWRETENYKNARVYCLLSFICLSMKGLWIYTNVDPNGFNIFEARGLSLFVVFHFYFMVKAGVELFVKNVGKRLI